MSLKDLWSLHHRQTIFVRTVVNRFAWRGFLFIIFFFNRREKKVISGQRWSSLSPGISMRWGTSHLVLCKFLNLLFIFHCGHHFLFTLIFQGTWHHTVMIFSWCCVREILCKTMMKGSLEIRHRLFIKIYVYVFQL